MLGKNWKHVKNDLPFIENIFLCFSQFAERSFHSAITGDQPSLGIPCLQLPYEAGAKNSLNFPDIFSRASGNF